MAGQERRNSLEDNPNIGALGRSEYQEGNRRVKGFGPKIITSVDQYIKLIHEDVLPIVAKESEASRIIHRVIAQNGIFKIGDNLGDTPLKIEASVTLGGRWEGHSWVMVGANFPGRALSEKTYSDLVNLAKKASEQNYEAAKPLPPGFTTEIVKADGNVLSDVDYEDLARIFKASFENYISKLTTAQDVRNWVADSSTFPLVARNPEGRIVVVTSGDLGQTTIDGKEFKFLEIGDSASNPDYRKLGLNRNLKALLISEGKKLGFDSIHAETRAAWDSPNYGNAKNGMSYFGTLPMNCVISGIETVPETKDPNLDDFYRKFGSLNVWAITPANPHWKNY